MKKCIKYFIGCMKAFLNNVHKERKCYIGMNVKFCNKGDIFLKQCCIIRPGTHVYSDKGGVLNLGEHVEIGRDSTIATHNRIIIEKGVLTGPHVFISDHNHEYENPDVPIYKQGIRMVENSTIIIGEGSWLGTNVVVVGNVRVGKNCVIGANSVVTKDIPDYCVAAGIPAKVIKKYDYERREWVRN